MKKFLPMLVFIFALLPDVAFAGTKLHMVLCGNTSDNSIGRSMLVDVSYYDRLSKELKAIIAEENVELIYHRFLGSNCNPAMANDYLDGLSCKGDIVFFIYTGHGGRSHNDTPKFPRMCMGSHYASEWLKVSDVVNKLKSKGAKFQIVIADCCNSYYDSPARQSAEDFAGQASSVSPSVIKNLFLNSIGNVCITAASPGEYGWCNSVDGSYLSYYFFNILRNADSGTTWQNLFEMVSDKTFERTDGMYRNRRISKSQRPVFDVFVGDEYGVDNGDDDNDVVVDDNDDDDGNDVVVDDNDDDGNDVVVDDNDDDNNDIVVDDNDGGYDVDGTYDDADTDKSVGARFFSIVASIFFFLLAYFLFQINNNKFNSGEFAYYVVLIIALCFVFLGITHLLEVF